jgi:PPOX class probable F420-dependent enzyme
MKDAVRQLVTGKNFATVATIGPDGGPQASVVWIDLDGEELVFSSLVKRQKVKNIERDPRVAVTIFDHENPYHSAEIRGTAELVDDPNKEWSVRLSQKYLGEDPPEGEPESDLRYAVRITPEKVNEFCV